MVKKVLNIVKKIRSDTENSKDRHRVAFLAIMDEVQAGLAAGASSRHLWQILKKEGKLGCSYITFTRYVKTIKKGAAKDTTSNNYTQGGPAMGSGQPKEKAKKTGNDLTEILLGKHLTDEDIL